jgi:anti-sigma regulatory factor (Ser/Thr protein kinase)
VLDSPGAPPYTIESPDRIRAGAVIVARSALVSTLRAQSPTARVIAIGAPEQLFDCMRAGAYSFFVEPVSPASFRDVLHNALAAENWQDDIVLVSAIPQWVTLQVRCKMQTLDRLAQFIRVLERDLPGTYCDDIVTAFRELVANAIEHGGREDPEKILRISRIASRRARVYEIHDPGAGFSLDDLEHAAISNAEADPLRHAEVRNVRGIRPGGFGILLSRNLADELLYNEKGNEVLLIKYVPER